MSYAVIQTGGKQYKVSAGEIIKVEKLPDSNPDTKVEFKEILAYGDDKSIELGEPTVSGAKVEAELLKNGKERTVLIFKKRRRKNSRRKNGHRQQYSLIRINKNLKAGIPTIPSILKDELECNIFLKAENIETFSKLRDLKDNF